MRAASQPREVVQILARRALWFCACNLLAAALSAQCTNPTQVPNGAYTSGDHSQADNNALSAGNFAVSGGASATFVAGNCIQLLPGFHANAIGATVPTTFHARLGTVPDFSLTLSCPQNMQFGVQSNCSVTALPSGGFNQNIYNLTMSITPTSGGWSVYPIPGLAPPNWSSPIQITPQSGPSGWYYLQISGTSAGGAIQHTAVSDVYVTQTPAPQTITPTSLPGGQQGTAYSQNLYASGGTAPYTWSLYSGSLPPGLTLSGGTISGAPSSAGTYNFGIKVADSASQTATQVYTVTISGSLTITTTSLPNGQPGTAYSQMLYASGGTAPYMWPLYSGSLPPGLTLSGATISGTPSSASTYNFTIKVADSASHTATQGYTVTISGAALTLTTTASPSGWGTISPWCPGGCSYTAGSQLTVTATPNSGYAFSSFTGTYSGTANPLTINLTGTATIAANFVTGYTISGQVTLSGGSGVSGVSISASGSQNASATTDANGLYSLPALPAGGNYTVTASKSGYLLSAPRTFNNLAQNQSASFTALPTLSINGGGNTAEVAPGANVSMAFNLYDQAGANDIAWAQFYLADSSGTAYCYGDWGRPNGLDLYDGNTGTTWGFGITQTDSFCTVSLASITNSPTDPSEVTVTLNFRFNPWPGGTYSVLTQVNYGSGYAGPWEPLGTLILDTGTYTEDSGGSAPGQLDAGPPADNSAPPGQTSSSQLCDDLSGTWADLGFGPFTSGVWNLNQGTSIVNGTATLRNACGTAEYNVSGSSTAGVAILAVGNPQPQYNSCGVPNPQISGFTVIANCEGASPSMSWTVPTYTDQFGQQVPQQFGSGLSAWARTTATPQITLVTDVVNDVIQVTLSGPKTTGQFVVTLNGPQAIPIDSGQMGQSTHLYHFNRTNQTRLPLGRYYSVTASWDNGLYSTVATPAPFINLGQYRFSQYNTPYESQCSQTTPVPVYVYENNNTCQYYVGSAFNSTFLSQTNLNGHGYSLAYGLVKPYGTTYLKKNWCNVPTEDPDQKNGTHTFVIVTQKQDTGGLDFQHQLTPGQSVAVYVDPPNTPGAPTTPAAPFGYPWGGGEKLLLFNTSNVNDPVIKTVQDICPGCNSNFNGTNGHIDVFSSTQFCNARDPANVDYQGSPWNLIRLIK